MVEMALAIRTVIPYTFPMIIRSIRHRGLRKFAESDNLDLKDYH